MTWLNLIKKNWRILSLIAGLVVAGLLIYSEYQRVDRQGYNRGVNECNLEKLKTINENIDIKKKQDRVVPFAGKRELINGLRDGSAL